MKKLIALLLIVSILVVFYYYYNMKSCYQSEDEVYLLELSKKKLIPQDHISYLQKLKSEGFEPKVIYDIGACVLHWTKEAEQIWPDAKIIVFDAMDITEFLYKDYDHFNGVLSDVDGRMVDFTEDTKLPGGNSYYRENENQNNSEYLRNAKTIKKTAYTLDSVVKDKKFPLPDFIKIDVHGAEVDVLRGATDSLKNVQRMVIELQEVDYNKGAPKVSESLPFIESLGFTCTDPKFCNNGSDADYGFVRVP
jgi:FkbM family methyltransferase